MSRHLEFGIQNTSRKTERLWHAMISKKGGEEREREMLQCTGSNLSLLFVVTSYLMLTHQSPEPSERKKERKKKIIHYQWASYIRRWRAVGDVQTLRNIINITDGFLLAMLSFQLQMRTAAEELSMTMACLFTSSIKSLVTL